MVEIHSTVGKRAKRMPDATVETTKKTIVISVISVPIVELYNVLTPKLEIY